MAAVKNWSLSRPRSTVTIVKLPKTRSLFARPSTFHLLYLQLLLLPRRCRLDCELSEDFKADDAFTPAGQR